MITYKNTLLLPPALFLMSQLTPFYVYPSGFTVNFCHLTFLLGLDVSTIITGLCLSLHLPLGASLTFHMLVLLVSVLSVPLDNS